MGDEKFKDAFKILVLGDEGVGKTTLIKHYSEKIFEKDVSPIVGVEFYIKHVDIDGHDYKLQFWDFFNEEKFGSMHTMYYKGASAIFYIFDLSKPETIDNYQKYLNKVWDEAKVNKCPVLLIGNKLDLVKDPNKIDREKYYKLVRQEGFLGYIETSMNNLENIIKQVPNIIQSTLRKIYQVKFLVNSKELEDIKRFSQLSHQTQSEFIRTAIWDKIKAINTKSMTKNSKNSMDLGEDKLSLTELKKIRKLLEKYENLNP